mmetsp:Transcript_18351/g.42317  ORF Transcript_18351/g.42317 Transcript_18351/m.42317 type:complete len:287 (-) Transcript_18351:475-1335(-)
MGLAAKRFLQGRLRRRLEYQESVIPMKAIVVKNEKRSSCSTLLPPNTKDIGITHERIAMSQPVVTIVLNQFKTYCSQANNRSINRQEKQQYSWRKPVIGEKPLRELGSDDIIEHNASECTAEVVPSSSIFHETYCSKRSDGAINRGSDKKRNSFATTASETSGSKSIQHAPPPLTPIRTSTIPKNFQVHCNEGKYWVIDRSKKKRSCSNRRATASPRGVAKRSAMKLKSNHSALVPKNLQNHCREGPYWEIDPSRNKRTRSAKKRLFEFSSEKKQKRKARLKSRRR